MPHGTQRTAVTSFLKDIKWKAKPLQPGKAQAGAMSWNIGTSEDPPSGVLTGFGRDILATEIKVKPNQRELNGFIASSRTQTHMRGVSSKTCVDPWQADATLDPWHKAIWNQAPLAPPTTTGKSHLNEVTDKIRAELKDSIRKEFENLSTSTQEANMVDATAVSQLQDQTEARFRKLEVSVSEVQAQNQQLQGWFQQLGAQQTATEQALTQVQGTLATHNQEFQKISAEVNNMNVSIRGEVRQAMADHQNDVDSRFDRLEALLAKKMKPAE